MMALVLSLCIYGLIKLMYHVYCFKAKKDVAQIFNNILRRQIGARSPTVEYICSKKEILFTLVKG